MTGALAGADDKEDNKRLNNGWSLGTFALRVAASSGWWISAEPLRE
jgi:hypothetical protein